MECFELNKGIFVFQIIHLFFSCFFSFPVWSLMVLGHQQYVQL